MTKFKNISVDTTLGGNAPSDDIVSSQNAIKTYVDSHIGPIADSTNCITKIPQDIKLELNNGTLTLKAGSKVYVPNGAGVFDVVTIQNDVSLTDSSNSKHLIGYNNNNNTLYIWRMSDCFSGATEPSASFALWYDTTNNLVKQKIDNIITNSVSLPIATVTTNASQITSIDQVFNGFGYIGSTVFVLPGVKGLIPNGRNADGSLKSNEFETYNVLTSTSPYANIKDYQFCINGDSIHTPGNNTYSYDDINNFYIFSNSHQLVCCVGHFATGSSNKVTNFYTKPTLHITDYGDKEFIARQAMPSDRYVDLTVGVSGASYTAPGYGWVTANFTATGGNGWGLVTTAGDVVGQHCFWPTTGGSTRAHIPVRKGQTFSIIYGAATLDRVRFTFSEGEA